MMLRISLLALVTIAPGALAQTAGPAGRVPSGWRWAPDAAATVAAQGEAGDTTIIFSTMPPGWHLTTGPGLIAWDPRIGGTGRYTIELEVYHFPQPAGGEYGLFLGGRGLSARAPFYVAVLVRGDGSLAVVEQSGPKRREIIPWVRDDSIRAQAPDGPVKNVLRIAVGSGEVSVVVNGVEITRFGRTPTMEGPFGLRVGPKTNLHIARLDVTHELAPVSP